MSLSFRIVVWQVAATVVAAGAFWSVRNVDQGFAALLGGLTVAIPAAVFAWRASVERSAQKLLVLGVVKFVSTCVLLGVGIVAFKPAPAGFFATFVLVHLMYVTVPMLSGKETLPGG